MSVTTSASVRQTWLPVTMFGALDPSRLGSSAPDQWLTFPRSRKAGGRSRKLPQCGFHPPLQLPEPVGIDAEPPNRPVPRSYSTEGGATRTPITVRARLPQPRQATDRATPSRLYRDPKSRSVRGRPETDTSSLPLREIRVRQAGQVRISGHLSIATCG